MGVIILTGNVCSSQAAPSKLMGTSSSGKTSGLSSVVACAECGKIKAETRCILTLNISMFAPVTGYVAGVLISTPS